MPSGFEIAEGFLEITADDSKARRTLRGFLAESKITGELFEQNMADSGERGGEKLADGLRRNIAGRLIDSRGRFVRMGEGVGRDLGEGISRGVDGGRRGGIFSRLFSGLTSGISGGIGQLREIGSTLRDVGEVTSRIGSAMAGLLQFAALAALIPTIVAVAGALSQLVGVLLLLPGAVGFALAAILPLVIAFKGFGEAISAVASGDVDKINEALKNLSPSARKLAMDIGTLMPLFKRFKTAVQEAFFAPVVDQFGRNIRTMLPVLQTGMTQVAGAFGRVAALFTEMLGNSDALASFRDIFAATARIIDRLGPSLVNFFGTILGMAQDGMPYIERMFGAIGRGMDKMADFLGGAMKSGDFEAWIDNALRVMGELWDLGVALTNLLRAIFAPTANEGETFIISLTRMTEKLTEFFRSAEGVEFLENFVNIVRESGPILMTVAGILIWLANANNTLIDGIRATVEWFRNLDDVIGGWLDGSGSAVGGWLSSVGAWFRNLGATIAQFVTEKASMVGNWFAALPGRIGAALTAIPGLVSTALNAMAYLFGYYIGLSAAYVVSLPGRIIGALIGLYSLITGWVSSAWNSAAENTRNGIDRVVAFAYSLPGRVASAVSQVWSAVTNTIASAWASGAERTRAGVQWVVDTAYSLPGRIRGALAGAASWLYGAGQDIMRGVANGMSSMFGWLVDRARSVASGIISGFKRGLGIASPSKVMAREVGRWIPPGIVEGMKSGLPKMQRFVSDVSSSLPSMMNAPTTVTANVGGVTVLADFGDGVRQVVKAQIVGQPRTVAAATDEGRRQRSRANTARART